MSTNEKIYINNSCFADANQLFRCESFVVRGDSVYIKLYNGTGKNLKIITLDEYEDSVLKSTIVAENADKSSYRPGENLIFEVLLQTRKAFLSL